MCRFWYTQLARLALPFALWRAARRGKAGAPLREYLGFCPPPPAGAPPAVWLHCVSVGEAAAARALAQKFADAGFHLLLTHTTAGGRAALARQHPQATVCALPLDLPSACARFLRRARPALGVVLEAEYWPNLLFAAKAAGVPLLLANARLGAANARRYKRVGRLMRQAVGAFDLIAAQTARDAARLRCFGGRNVTTCGNLKFDLPPAAAPAAAPLAAGRPVVCVAATRAGEEPPLLAGMDDNFFKRCFVVWAPRHPQRGAALAALLQKRGIAHTRRSAGEPPRPAQTAVYIADTLGEMARWYDACDAVVVGGGFAKQHGGQNPIEAMRHGKPAVTGLFMRNYAQLTRRAVAAGALQQSPAAAAAACALQLAQNPARAAAMAARAKSFCLSQGGALARHWQLAQRLPPLAPVIRSNSKEMS